MKRLRIAIASAGRFHVLDLARELHALGHEVRFYSYVPKARARSFGLPDACHVSLLPFVSPLLLWMKLAPRYGAAMRERCFDTGLNRALMQKLQPCDVIIGMSGIYLEALRFAKARFGARIWLERGSRHIVSQDEILARIPGAERPSAYSIRRELEGYIVADRIVVPSQHVVNSFDIDKSASAKLFLNPYGVDLSMFPLFEREDVAHTLKLLYVGTWSLQKGCDILVQAVKNVSNVKLTHIGSIGDYKFPFNTAQFEHFPAVNQRELITYYKAADAFVLASQIGRAHV